MERLISTKSQFPKPRVLSSRLAPLERSDLLRLKPVRFSLFSKQEGPPPLSLSRSSSSNSYAINNLSDLVAVEKKKKEEFQCIKLRSGKDLSVLSFLKVASVVALFSLTILITRPAHASIFPTAISSGGKRLIGSEILGSAWTGFFAGCLHTLSGPDHLVALAPLSIGRTRTESALVGALWGFGHDAGQVIFGLLFLLLKDRLHLETIGTWGSIIVGLTLFIIGLLGIKEATNSSHTYLDLENNNNNNNDNNNTPNNGKKKVGFATFATGIVHGLQADALMMVLPALALPSRLAGSAFLIMFLIGTVFAMASYTVFICSCSQALKEKVPRVTEKLTWGASLLAMFMGVAIVLSQFFGFSLFG